MGGVALIDVPGSEALGTKIDRMPALLKPTNANSEQRMTKTEPVASRLLCFPSVGLKMQALFTKAAAENNLHEVVSPEPLQQLGRHRAGFDHANKPIRCLSMASRGSDLFLTLATAGSAACEENAAPSAIVVFKFSKSGPPTKEPTKLESVRR